MISAEWVATVATGIPVYAGAGLLVWGQGLVWRRTLWEEHGPALLQIASGLEGRVSPLWTGWRIRGPRAEFRLAGGLRGARARLVAGARTHQWSGMPTAEAVLQEI